MNVIVVAKEPVPGRVKTRLCPPCTPTQAATLAEAALADTLDAAVTSGADGVILVLDGRPGPWCPPGVRVVEQCEGPFGRRLQAAWDHTLGPAVQIGMDTPQVRARDLDDAMGWLDGGQEADAVIGLAADGGWWLLGMQRARPGMFDGVPMSSADTGSAQIERLRDLGLRVRTTRTLRDLDTIADLPEVVDLAPAQGRFRVAAAALDATAPPSIGDAPVTPI